MIGQGDLRFNIRRYPAFTSEIRRYSALNE